MSLHTDAALAALQQLNDEINTAQAELFDHEGLSDVRAAVCNAELLVEQVRFWILEGTHTPQRPKAKKEIKK